MAKCVFGKSKVVKHFNQNSAGYTSILHKLTKPKNLKVRVLLIVMITYTRVEQAEIQS